jgi:hypothetical protein
MNWGGSTVYTLWGYRPLTKPAVRWIKTADGNWSGEDRTASEDVYEARVVFKGSLSQLQTLETVLDSNRENFNITCGVGEEIYGADVDYSGAIDSTVIKYDKIRSVNKGIYSMGLTLRAVSVSNTGSASLSSLKLATHQYEAYSEFDINKQSTLDNTMVYLDGVTDPGIFKGVFKQTTAQMKAIRRYLLTTARTATLSSFDFSAFGVTKPFGQRVAGSGTYDTKIIDWEDMGRDNYQDWRLGLTFARVI